MVDMRRIKFRLMGSPVWKRSCGIGGDGYEDSPMDLERGQSPKGEV